MPGAGPGKAMTIPLALEGRLDLAFNAERLELVGIADAAVLTLPSLSCGWRIYRSLSASPLGSRLVHCIEALVAMDLRVDVVVSGRVVLSAGARRAPSRLFRALALPPVKIHWGGLARSLLKL
jgi:hypothetical protein